MIKHWKKTAIAIAIVLLFGGVTAGLAAARADQQNTAVEQLGEFLYFDKNLSEPNGQSCADCHDPAFGFDDQDEELPVSEGVIPGLFGNRNSPISAYAMYTPEMFFDEIEGLWIGGMFWDGRATGTYLGDPLADQAIGPFLNPVEMANTGMWQVVRDVANSEYTWLFEEAWGYDITKLKNVKADNHKVTDAYNKIGLSIAAFERTALFGQFSSKYDYYVKTCLKMGGTMEDCAMGVGQKAMKAGKKIFTKQEWDGLQLFMGENDNDGMLTGQEGAACFLCHVADWTAVEDYALPVQSPGWAPEGMVPPVFTDHTFDNLGIPVNEDVWELLGSEFLDYGLGAILGDMEENGKFRVVTLRNIGLSAPYGHNGYFKTLKDITHFYNTRDVENWEDPEYAFTVNQDELGNLGLSEADEEALVAFMMTLSDGFKP